MVFKYRRGNFQLKSPSELLKYLSIEILFLTQSLMGMLSMKNIVCRLLATTSRAMRENNMQILTLKIRRDFPPF